MSGQPGQFLLASAVSNQSIGTAHYCVEMQNSWYFLYENRNQYSQANQASYC